MRISGINSTSYAYIKLSTEKNTSENSNASSSSDKDGMNEQVLENDVIEDHSTTENDTLYVTYSTLASNTSRMKRMWELSTELEDIAHNSSGCTMIQNQIEQLKKSISMVIHSTDSNSSTQSSSADTASKAVDSDSTIAYNKLSGGCPIHIYSKIEDFNTEQSIPDTRKEEIANEYRMHAKQIYL